MSTKILGIDPGLNITGYALIESEGTQLILREAGILRGKKAGCMGERLAQLYQNLSEVIDQHRPDVLALEELYSHYERPRTAILMGHARGVFCLAAGLANIPVFDYSATQVKKVLTGNGRAPKSQVQMAVMRQFHLDAAPDPPDVADAIAIASCHIFLSRQNALLKGQR